MSVSHRVLKSLLSTVFSVMLSLAMFLPVASGQPQADIDDSSDRATMVIMAPDGPVFADVRVSVAKQPYRVWLGKYLARQLDADGSGTLNHSELSGLTPGIRRLASVSGPDDILDSAARDSSNALAGTSREVSAADFSEWIRHRLPRAFDLIAQPQSSDDAVRLASLIDTNRDTLVTEEELLAAFRTLRYRDLDNDETFGLSELLPYRDPLSANAPVTPDVANLPFFHLTNEESLRTTAAAILQRYGNGQTVAFAKFRQTPDQDQVAELDQVATQQLLANPDHHLIIDVRLSDRANTSDIDVVLTEHAASFCGIIDDRFGQTKIYVDSLPLQIVARGGGANNRAATRGFLGQTFVMQDADRNQYLDESEFAGLQSALQQSGAAGGFADVDQNSDNMITRDELFSFVDRELASVASRIEVTVRQDGKTLFGLLDANHDRRLSVREIRAGAAVLMMHDLNGDEVFSESELGTQYVLTFGLGRSELRRTSGSMQMTGRADMRRADAILPGTSALKGPEWFRRMDRNQDGDVSRREFPGTPEQFLRVDIDRDQLISAEEAESLEKGIENQ